MPYNNSYIDVGKNNPLADSLYTETFTEGAVAPGNPMFLITEDGLYITTEDGKYITTEG